MYRYAIEDLKAWASNKTPKPLVLRGARQVDKSTLVKLFCIQHGYELIEINLEKNKSGNWIMKQAFQLINLFLK